jgi:putative serine protease PepD
MRQTYRAAALVASAALAAGAATSAVIATQGSSRGAVTTTVTQQAATPAAATTTSDSVSAIYQANVDGVVEIRVQEQSSSDGGYSPFGPQQQSTSAQGTGFEIDDKGDIVTNAHVVSGASSITVETKDGTTYKATLVGSDETTDVAVIHIDASARALHPLTFGDSSALQVGDGVVAIGDPFGLADSVSAGIVSALDRTITSPNNRPIHGAIQTDAAINHGNSGGPLFDEQGQVVGITSQIYADSSTSGNVGIGFAVPSATVKQVVSQLISTGKAVHPYLGVYLENADRGARITKVSAGSPAASAGLRTGEVITSVDGRATSGAGAVVDAISQRRPGDTVDLTVRSGSGTRRVSVKLGSLS